MLSQKVVLACMGLVLCLTACAQPNNEFQFGMGIPDGPDPNYDLLPVKARLTTANYRAVGSSASLEKYAPTPQSQGQYGTCTAWAAGYCARTILEAQRQGWTDRTKIDEHTFSYGFIYRVTSPKLNCNGAYVADCFQNMRDIGIPKYKDFTEHCPQSAIPASVYSKAAKYKIKGYATLWNAANPATDKQKVQLVKKSIDEGNPVVIAMYVPQSFCYSKGPTWTRKSTDLANGDQGHQHGRHAMCIIGYDDDQDGGAFRIQNSWGDKWADKGFIWIKYEDAATFIYQAIEMFKLPAVNNENEKIKLAGSVKLVEDTGQEMKARLAGKKGYRINKAYRSGTRFRLYLNNEQPAYVYAIGSDLSQKIYQVFPHAKGVSPALNYSSNTVPIPSEDHHIRMDGNVGTDYLCVLYSKRPLDLDNIKRDIKQQSNQYSFQEKVQKVLANQLITGDDIDYDSVNGKMSFKAEAKGKSVAALFVEMEHID